MLESGALLGNYRIVRSLGRGGMADVYEAEDQRLGRRVALKILPPELARNPQLVQRFEKEVRASALLNHRGIVTVFEVGAEGGSHYYTMRLLTGGDLRSFIARGLSEPETLAIVRELADAFAHAHSRGFVHRDLKPENVIFDEQGFPVLTDFGIAKALDRGAEQMTLAGVALGTPRYISPEQARGKPVDQRTDLYSLGVVLFEMLTGKPPFDGEPLAVIFKHATDPIPRLPVELAHLQDLVDRLMAKDPEQRVASGEALVQMIDALPKKSVADFQQTIEMTAFPNLMKASPLRPEAMKTPAPAPRPAPPTVAPPDSDRDAARARSELVARKQGEAADAARKKQEIAQREAETRRKAQAAEAVLRQQKEKAESDQQAAERRAQQELEDAARREAEAARKAEDAARQQREKDESERLAAERRAQKEREVAAKREAEAARRAEDAARKQRDKEESERQAAERRAQKEREAAAKREAAEARKTEELERKRLEREAAEQAEYDRKAMSFISDEPGPAPAPSTAPSLTDVVRLARHPAMLGASGALLLALIVGVLLWPKDSAEVPPAVPAPKIQAPAAPAASVTSAPAPAASAPAPQPSAPLPEPAAASAVAPVEPPVVEAASPAEPAIAAPAAPVTPAPKPKIVKPRPAPKPRADNPSTSPKPSAPSVARPAPGAETAPMSSDQRAIMNMLSDGRAAYDRRDYKSAISIAESVLFFDPENKAAQKLLADAERARRR